MITQLRLHYRDGSAGRMTGGIGVSGSFLGRIRDSSSTGNVTTVRNILIKYFVRADGGSSSSSSRSSNSSSGSSSSSNSSSSSSSAIVIVLAEAAVVVVVLAESAAVVE
jgi:hypothetical protein